MSEPSSAFNTPAVSQTPRQARAIKKARISFIRNRMDTCRRTHLSLALSWEKPARERVI